MKSKKKLNSRGWLNLMPHCPPSPPPLDSFDCNSFDWKVAWPNQKRKQLPRMQLDRAETSCWARVNEETRPEYQTRGGREQKMSLQPTKGTYKSFSEARESKMPDGSTVRSLEERSLKPTTNQVDQIVRVDSISRPIAHHHH